MRTEYSYMRCSGGLISFIDLYKDNNHFLEIKVNITFGIVHKMK